MNMLEASEVRKSYDRTEALKGFSISIENNSIFALLGPNGAGKTTFVKSLLGLVKLSGGSIKINGLDYQDVLARKNIAFLPEKFSFFPYYTVEAVLVFYAKIYNVKAGEIESRVNANLKRLGIEKIRKQVVKTLSKGQLQRAGIASLLMGDADFLIFDEPFSGLDPIGIKELKELFLELKNEGKTLFLNSHILGDVEQVADHIAIINDGQCLAQGPLQELKGQSSLEDFFYKTIKGQG